MIEFRTQDHRNHSPSGPIMYVETPQQQQPKQQQLVPLHFNTNSSLPTHLREHFSKLQQDNSVLSRQIAYLHSELDILQRDKANLHTNLTHFMKLTTDTYDLLNPPRDADSNIDRVNQFMKDDLQYERDRNSKVSTQIEHLKEDINEGIKKMKVAKREHENMSKLNQELTYRLLKEGMMIQEKEKEGVIYFERMEKGQGKIQKTKVNIELIESENLVVTQAFQDIIAERNNLLEQVNELSIKLQERASQYIQEKSVLIDENETQKKYATAKLIANVLQTTYFNKVQETFFDLRSYTQFDHSCKIKLQRFSTFLEGLGNKKILFALSHWFAQTIKPMQQKKQSEQIVSISNDISIKSQYFIVWRKQYNERMNQYEQKTVAINQMWDFLCKEGKIEKSRVFRIWYDKTKTLINLQIKLKRILNNKFNLQQQEAFRKWKKYSLDFGTQMRLHLMKVKFANQRYLKILFSYFRIQSLCMKRMRMTKLSSLFKIWKQFQSYNKYLKTSRKMMLKFRNNGRINLIKACFDNLKQSSVINKLLVQNDKLENGELSQIVSLKEINQKQLNKIVQINKERALKSIITQLQKQIWSYLLKWRLMNDEFQSKLKTTIQDRLITLYLSKIRKSFNHWHYQHAKLKLSEQQTTFKELGLQYSVIINDGIATKNQNILKKQEIVKQRMKHLMKCFERYDKRVKHATLGRWRDRINQREHIQKQVKILLRKYKMAKLNKGFKEFLKKVQEIKQSENREQEIRQFRGRNRQQLKKQVILAWNWFKCNHQQAKKQWQKLFMMKEQSIKRIAMKKWTVNAQLIIIKELDSKQQSIASIVESLNHNAGSLNNNESGNLSLLEERKNLLFQQAQRVLANTLVRFHSVNLYRGFDKWAYYTIFEKNRERLIDKIVIHQRKHQFGSIKSRLIQHSKCMSFLEKQKQTKKEEKIIQDVLKLTKIQELSYKNERFEVIQQLNIENKEISLSSKRLQNIISLIIKRSKQNDFISRKRYIFQKWRNAKDKRFVFAVKNILTKSMLQNGLTSIKYYVADQMRKDKQLQYLKKQILNKIRSQKKQCFLQWKSHNYIFVKSQNLTFKNSLIITHDQNSLQIARIKKQQSLNAERNIHQSRLHRIFKEFQMVINLRLKVKASQNLCKAKMMAIQKQQAILKWRNRNQLTTKRRQTFQKIESNQKQILIKKCFKELQIAFYQKKELVHRIANLVIILNHQSIQQGFISLNNYAQSKIQVYQERKINASRWIGESLTSILHRRTNHYYHELRKRALNKRKTESLLRNVLISSIKRKLRLAYEKWRKTAKNMTLIKDFNQEGPIRVLHEKERFLMNNLKVFLYAEGYDDSDQQAVLKSQKQKQTSLMMKTVKRLQHFNEEKYVIPKAFDRWRMYLKMRKLFKYWINYVDVKVNKEQSRMQTYFEKWKQFYPQKLERLEVKSKDILIKSTIKNNLSLDLISQEIIDKEKAIIGLNDQKQTLLDNYIKAQKLVFSLWSHRRKNIVHQFFKQWSHQTTSLRNFEKQVTLKRNLNMLELLKIRIKQIENQNETKAHENDELRRFQFDGFEIAKSVESLSIERKAYSVDISEQAKTIQKLLDENQYLNNKLILAQKHAETLILSTMKLQEQFMA